MGDILRITKKAIAVSAAVLAAAGGGILVSSSADAAQAPAPRTIAAGTPLGQGSVTGWHVKDHSLNAVDLDANTVKWFTGGPFNNSVNSNTVKDGSLGEADLNKALNDKLVLGTGGEVLTIPATPIKTIGGSWVVGKTLLKTFTLKAGTWLVNSAVVFDRVNSDKPTYLVPTTDTMPQFGLRYDITAANGNFGEDAGTVMGNPVSRAGFVELTGSSTKAVTLTKDTDITAYGFGYNEDRSGFGGDQISVSGTVSAIKIG